MKITVINGSMRKGSTWQCKELLLQKLAGYGETEVREFFLPKDMPHFCSGCFNCFFKGEDTCPHADSVQPIAKALLDADLIILNSSVYALDVTAQMKALLDHLCYQWMSHRPDPRMFNKIGVTFVTTAGAGLSHATKTLRNSLRFWGVKRIYSQKFAVAATKWDEVPAKTKANIQKESERLARHVAHDVQHAKELSSPFIRGILMRAMSGAMQKYDWNPRDLQYWESHGWFKGVNRP